MQRMNNTNIKIYYGITILQIQYKYHQKQSTFRIDYRSDFPPLATVSDVHVRWKRISTKWLIPQPDPAHRFRSNALCSVPLCAVDSATLTFSSGLCRAILYGKSIKNGYYILCPARLSSFFLLLMGVIPFNGRGRRSTSSSGLHRYSSGYDQCPAPPVTWSSPLPATSFTVTCSACALAS